MRAFWAKLSKKAIFGHPPQKKRKFWLITEKLFRGYFCVFFLSCFFFFFVLFLFFIGFVFWGGFKGQVRWPFGPPHLALNPPYFLLFCFLFSFPFFASNRKKPVFPLEKGVFCLFLSVSLCFSLAFFGLPLLQFLFLCSFLLFFLLVFPFCFLLVPCFSLFLSFSFFFAFVSWKEQHQNIKLQLFFHQYFLFFVSCLLFSFQSLFLIFAFFLIWSYVFGSTSMLLVSSNQSSKTPIFGQKRGCNKTGLFYEPVFCKTWKVIVFFAHFWANFGWCSKTLWK